jgi:hypothetical protein
MMTPSTSEQAAKALGPLLWLAGFAVIFLANELWPWGGLCAGTGYLSSSFGYWKETERLRKEIEVLSSRGIKKWELV